MPAINFPSNPSNNELFIAQGKSMRYNAAKNKWNQVGTLTAAQVTEIENKSIGVASMSVSGNTLVIQKDDSSFANVSLAPFAGNILANYASASQLPMTNLVSGTQVYVTDTDSLFITDGSGWFKIATVNLSPSLSLGVASISLSSGGSVDVNYTINEPEDTPFTISASATSNATITVHQSNNTITFDTPTASSTETITISATDGVNTVADTLTMVVSLEANWSSIATTAILEGDAFNQAQGEQVSLNKDGTILAVGVRHYNGQGGTEFLGAVRVYKKSGGTWSLKQTLTSNEYVPGVNNYYGKSVVIAADGHTIAIGNGLFGHARGVHIWTSSDNGETWNFQDSLLGSGVIGGDSWSADGNIDLSDNGNILVVGAKFDDDSGSNAGAVYVYTRSGTTWTFRQKLNANKPAGARFGSHCRLSGDGQYLAVGAPYEDTGHSYRGTVVIYYTPNGGLGWNLTASFQSNDIANDDFFGDTVAIDTDGDTLAVSSESGIARSVYVFTRSGSTWTQQAKLEHPNAASGDNFGYGNQNPVISGDGNTLYIGSNGDDDNGNNAGRGFIFTRTGTTWSMVGTNVTPLASTYAPGNLRGVEAFDHYGSRLAISRDGTTVAGGNEYHNNNSSSSTGAAYVIMPSNLA